MSSTATTDRNRVLPFNFVLYKQSERQMTRPSGAKRIRVEPLPASREDKNSKYGEVKGALVPIILVPVKRTYIVKRALINYPSLSAYGSCNVGSKAAPNGVRSTSIVLAVATMRMAKPAAATNRT